MERNLETTKGKAALDNRVNYDKIILTNAVMEQSDAAWPEARGEGESPRPQAGWATPERPVRSGTEFPVTGA